MSYTEEYLILKHQVMSNMTVIDIKTRIKYLCVIQFESEKGAGGLCPLLTPEGKPLQITEEELNYLLTKAVDINPGAIKIFSSDADVCYYVKKY